MRPTTWLTLVLVVCVACKQQEESETVVARVGDAVLLQPRLDAALKGLPGDVDTTSARAQVIEQWIEDELLYQESVRRNLGAADPVRQQLREAEHAVLVDALVAQIYEESDANLTEADIVEYYEAHKERLQTLEPFVLVRYIETQSLDSARSIRRDMAAGTDSLFYDLALRHATNPELSQSLASNYWPESRLFTDQPTVRKEMEALAPSRRGRVFAIDSLYYFLQVVDRAPAGTVPELAWIKEQVRIQCAIDRRKQQYARQVQRLRAGALARGQLVIRE